MTRSKTDCHVVSRAVPHDIYFIFYDIGITWWSSNYGRPWAPATPEGLAEFNMEVRSFLEGLKIVLVLISRATVSFQFYQKVECIVLFTRSVLLDGKTVDIMLTHPTIVFKIVHCTPTTTHKRWLYLKLRLNPSQVCTKSWTILKRIIEISF